MRFWLLLLFSAPFLWLNGADFCLSHSEKSSFKFNAPEEKNAILFFSARIKVPTPLEAWGTHAVEVKLNGKTLIAPVNKPQYLTDPQCVPQKQYPVVQQGRLWVKADSDWEVFNAPAGEIYSNIWILNQTNKTELSNRFYHFAFKLDNLKKQENRVDFKAILPPEMRKYPVEITGVEVRGFGDKIIFNRDWLQSVYPWSFPAKAELGGVECVKARNEHGFASFSIYCFVPQKFKLPVLNGDFQIYHLDNSNIPAKLQEAAGRHIPNIGDVYVPERFTPLAAGSSVDLPAGTTTFAIRFKGDKAGIYPAGTLPVTFKVVDIYLPESTDLPVENSMYIMAGGTDSQNMYPEFKEYGMSMVLLSPWTAKIPLKLNDGKLAVDFSNFDRWVKKYQAVGLSRKTLFFGTSEPIIKQISKLSGEKEDGKEFQRLFKEFIILFFNHADELGLKVYLSLYDEANFQKNVWDKTKLLTSIAVTVPNSRMWSTVTELASAAHYYEVLGYRKGRDLCITHPFQAYNKRDDEVSRGVLCPDKKIGDLRGRFVGEYEGIFSYPGANNRYAYGVRSALANLKYMTGFAFWWGDMYKENVKPYKYFYVTYPFREKITNVRYSSVGWEAIRCGIDDMRYWTLARRLLTAKYGEAEAGARLRAIAGAPQYSAAELEPGYFKKVRNSFLKFILENK